MEFGEHRGYRINKTLSSPLLLPKITLLSLISHVLGKHVPFILHSCLQNENGAGGPAVRMWASEGCLGLWRCWLLARELAGVLRSVGLRTVMDGCPLYCPVPKRQELVWLKGSRGGESRVL